MSKVSFLIKKLSTMDYGNIIDVAKKVHAKTGKNTLAAAVDILRCGAKYQAGPLDYMQAQMFNIPESERRNVITSGVNNTFVKACNDPAYFHFFENKADFNKKFADFIGRDWMLVEKESTKEASEKLRADYLKFIEGKNEFILKPVDGMGGEGVVKIEASPENFDRVFASAPCIIEEVIVQCKELAALNPSSVNTIRIITILKDGQVQIPIAYLRMGNGGIVDNFCSGGMLTPVDLETGQLRYDAADQENNVYPVHPTTGVTISGYQIPRFEEVKDFVRKAAMVVPEVRYVGWDVAIKDDGVCLIEGNEYPGHVFYIFANHHPDGNWMREDFEKMMGMRD